MGGGNGDQTSLHSKLFQDNFVFCDMCCNMNEESVLKNCRNLQKK
jgi:hypothetical protein